MCANILNVRRHCRTKTRLLEKGMEMRTRIKLMLYFISIMKV